MAEGDITEVFIFLFLSKSPLLTAEFPKHLGVLVGPEAKVNFLGTQLELFHFL